MKKKLTQAEKLQAKKLQAKKLQAEKLRAAKYEEELLASQKLQDEKDLANTRILIATTEVTISVNKKDSKYCDTRTSTQYCCRFYFDDRDTQWCTFCNTTFNDNDDQDGYVRHEKCLKTFGL